MNLREQEKRIYKKLLKNNFLVLRISAIKCLQYIQRGKCVVVISMGSRIRLIQAAISARLFTGKCFLLKHQFSTCKTGMILKVYDIYVYSRMKYNHELLLNENSTLQNM